MKTYRNISNQDGEISYDIGENSITLVFKEIDLTKEFYTITL